MERAWAKLKRALSSVAGAAWKIVNKRWYWLLGVLLLIALLGVFTHLRYAVTAFIIGITVVFFGLRAESFFGTGLVMSILTGCFLAVSDQPFASYCATVAFFLMCVGTLLGAWRLWKLTGTDEGQDADDREVVRS